MTFTFDLDQYIQGGVVNQLILTLKMAILIRVKVSCRGHMGFTYPPVLHPGHCYLISGHLLVLGHRLISGYMIDIVSGVI